MQSLESGKVKKFQKKIGGNQIYFIQIDRRFSSRLSICHLKMLIDSNLRSDSHTDGRWQSAVVRLVTIHNYFRPYVVPCCFNFQDHGCWSLPYVDWVPAAMGHGLLLDSRVIHVEK